MNRLSIAAGLSALGAVALSGQAIAACPSVGAEVPSLNTFLSGKTVCMQKNETWTDSKGNTTNVVAGYQEEHLSNGQLWDYKQGNPPLSNVGKNPPSADPRKQVGTWTVTNNNEVSYIYTDGSGPYTYKLYESSPNYCLVGNGEQLLVSVQGGINAPCANYPATN